MTETSPLLVALTGGIACGKTTATDMFATLGVPVIDADRIAHEVTAAGQPGLKRLIERLGNTFLLANGELNRPALRKKLFSDSLLRQQVNDLLHPLILAEMERRIRQQADADYIILAIPLAVETGTTRLADRVLVIDCDPQQQIARLRQRDNENAEQARQILAAQASRESRLSQADDVITNNDSLNSLRQQIERLHNGYQSLAKQADFKHNKR